MTLQNCCLKSTALESTDVDAHKHSTDTLVTPTITSRHGNLPLTLLHFSELPSTNLWCLQNVEALVNLYKLTRYHGVRVSTSWQTSGIGQREAARSTQSQHRSSSYRTWESKKGDLACSFVFQYPSSKLPELVFHPLVVGLAVVRTLTQYGVDARIKWPNDIVVNGKKLGGVLCQTVPVSKNSSDIALVIGIGLNIETAPAIRSPNTTDETTTIQPLPATCLNDVLLQGSSNVNLPLSAATSVSGDQKPSPIIRCATASNVLQELTANVYDLLMFPSIGGFPSLVPSIHSVLYRRGEVIKVLLEESGPLDAGHPKKTTVIQGVLHGICPDTGALKLIPENSQGAAISILHGRLF